MENVEELTGHMKKRKRKNRKMLVILLALVVALGIVGKIYYGYLLKPVDASDTTDINITIPSGSSTVKIASILKDNDLIKNEKFFVLLSKYKKTGSKYKAGSYVFNKGQDVNSIMAMLAAGTATRNTQVVTIPEGYEIKQIASKFSGFKNFDKENFLKLTSDASAFKQKYEFLKDVPQGLSLEGYLFPNTYQFYKDATEEEVIYKLLDEFQVIYDDNIKGKSFYKGFNINDVITMASIIERETKLDEERAIVSSVFYNRLDKKMRLGSCATVQYALGDRKKKLSIADTKIDSPYNTYINDGLPVGAIASPGLKSIISALNPQKTKFLYFVLTDYTKGSHTFTDNYNDFLKAKKAAKAK